MQETDNLKKIKQVSSATFQCPNCGSTLKYKAGTTNLHCDYCNTDSPIKAIGLDGKDFEEIPINPYLNILEDIQTGMSKIISCNNCGAGATFSEYVKSTFCPYCKTPLIEVDIHKVRMVQPSYLLPFGIQDKEIRNHLKKWIGSFWFAPSKLKKDILTDNQIQGMYIPCWTYDAQTETDYTGQRGEDYTVRSGSGDDETETTYTSWSGVSGHISVFFNDVLISASKYIYQDLLNRIGQKGGWDTHNMVKTDNRFLSGFTTEKYTVTLKEGYEIAHKTMAHELNTLICKQIGGDHQKISSKDTNYSDVTFKLVLLPIYVSSYSYRNKIYRFYVHGRNGSIVGDRPYSIPKIIGAVALGVLAVYMMFNI